MPRKIIRSAGAGVLKAGRTGFEYGLSLEYVTSGTEDPLGSGNKV